MINNTVEEVRKHVEQIVELLGIQKTKSNEDTPLRVAKMWCNELFANRNGANLQALNDSMKVFPNEEFENPITICEVDFHSMCEHHWLPFMGIAEVSYVPDQHIIGLSKIPRVVRYFAQRPQLQERLTKDIGEYLVNIIAPKSLTVKIRAAHQCVACRGAECDCKTITTFTYERGATCD